jgi:thiol-disulfide isomerase/thioredoxin
VVVLAAAVVAGALLAVVLLFVLPGGGSSNVTYLDSTDRAVLYTAGHRPLAPDFTGTTLTGSRFSFSSYRGRVVVVNFWGSWCDPCRAEAPALGVAAQQYRPSGVAFLGVDVRDTTASAEAFTHNFGITYPRPRCQSRGRPSRWWSTAPGTSPERSSARPATRN